jgi:hypothetical protein
VLYRALTKVRAGAAVVAQGKDPEQAGWNSLANLAWRAVHGGGLSCDDILENLWEPLPQHSKWANLDTSITDLWPDGRPAGGSSWSVFPRTLRARLYKLVFPTGDEVLAAYFLLLQLTGGEPSWAQSLSISAMQIRGNGCIVKGFKGRQPFATVKERVFPRLAGSRMCVPKLWDLMIELTAPVRHVRCAQGAADQACVWLHLDAGNYRLGIVRCSPSANGGSATPMASCPDTTLARWPWGWPADGRAARTERRKTAREHRSSGAHAVA